MRSKMKSKMELNEATVKDTGYFMKLPAVNTFQLPFH